MALRAWRVLVIDDDPDLAEDARREISEAFEGDNDIDVEVSIDVSFINGFERVRLGECDIVVLDVRRDAHDGEAEERDKGRRVYMDIREVRFLPVIFWTALPGEVSDQNAPPLIAVLPKDQLDRLPAAIRSAIVSGVAEVMAQVENGIARVIREHMWNGLVPNWREDAEGGRADDLVHMVITRVADTLQDKSLHELTSRSSHRYLYPPVSEKYRPGDVLRRGPIDDPEWLVILTPACDLEHDGKAEFALLARAATLDENKKYQKWRDSRFSSNNAWNDVRDLLMGKRARYLYLPRFRQIPDLLIDLEQIESVAIEHLKEHSRIASLVAPYREALVVQNSQFRGRVGTPDLDIQALKDRLSRPDDMVAESSGGEPPSGQIE